MIATWVGLAERAGNARGGGSIRNALYLTRDCSHKSDRPETYCACAVERATTASNFRTYKVTNVTTFVSIRYINI